jgi:hypothetical protein
VGGTARQEDEDTMVVTVRKFISGLFGTYAVAPPAAPTAKPAVPVEDHAGGRYFTRTPEGDMVNELLDAPEAPAPVAQTVAVDDGHIPHFATSPEDHHWTRSSGPHIATDLADPRPTTTRTHDM